MSQETRPRPSRARNLAGWSVLAVLLAGPVVGALALGLPWARALLAPHVLTLNVLQGLTGAWAEGWQVAFSLAASAAWLALFAFTRERWVVLFAALYILTQVLLFASVLGVRTPAA